MMATIPLAIVAGRCRRGPMPGQLLGAQPLGADLAQLGEGRDLEDPHGDLGLEAGQQALGQRVVRSTAASEREEERLGASRGRSGRSKASARPSSMTAAASSSMAARKRASLSAK